MKKLAILAIAGALIAPAAAAQAKPLQLTQNTQLAQVNPYVYPGHLTIRCLYKRISRRREWVKLRWQGFRKIRFTGYKVFRPRCAQFLYFKACKGRFKYVGFVRYIKLRRYVYARRVGFCRRFIPLPRPYYRVPGA